MIEDPVTTDKPDGFAKTFIPTPTLQGKELKTNRRILRGNAENERWLSDVVPEVFPEHGQVLADGRPRRGQNPAYPPKA
jgi:hypothetical protein